MRTALQGIPDCYVRIAVGLSPRVIILQVNNNVLSVVRDGKYKGWSPRLARQAFKREIFDTDDIGRWAATMEHRRAPIELEGDLKESFARLMEKHARLRFFGIDLNSGIDLEEQSYKRPPLWSKVKLTLFKAGGRQLLGDLRPAISVPIYRASIGRIGSMKEAIV